MASARGHGINVMKCIAINSIIISIVLLMAGCPRLAHVAIYNNTQVDILIRSSGIEESVGVGKIARLRLTGEVFEVETTQGRWTYRRNIPHNGEDGIFFDGTLRLQIDEDGMVYALKKDQSPPQAKLIEQPRGYPLQPTKASVSGF